MTTTNTLPLVHNHGPEDGPGMGCQERREPGGALLGDCLLRARRKYRERRRKHPRIRSMDYMGHAWTFARIGVVRTLSGAIDGKHWAVIRPDGRIINTKRTRYRDHSEAIAAAQQYADAYLNASDLGWSHYEAFRYAEGCQ